MITTRVTQFLCLWGLLVVAPMALAAEGAKADLDDFDEVITVYGDQFARWDHTRWFIDTEVGTPFPLKFAKNENREFRSGAFQVTTVIACEKEWELGKHHFEVGCTLEDVSLRAAVFEKKFDVEVAQEILDEWDAKLSGARVQLQVNDEGQVVSYDIEGLESDNRRENQILEALRQIMVRVMAGFDMKLRKFGDLREGRWTEYSSQLMGMPSETAAQSSSVLVHYLNRYKGHLLVQSIGKGIIASGEELLKSKLDGVAIYDEDTGFMTERVWALRGVPTASSTTLAHGGVNAAYWHNGRIDMLGDDEQVTVGETMPVSPPGQTREGLAAWVPLSLD